MKTQLIYAALFVAVTALTACREKMAETEEEITGGTQQTEQTRQDIARAQDEFQEYKKEQDARIAENEKRIAELRNKKSNEAMEVREKYNKRIDELEQKNRDMKRRIDEYRVEKKDNWESFKDEFKRDMDKLGDDIRDLATGRNDNN